MAGSILLLRYEANILVLTLKPSGYYGDLCWVVKQQPVLIDLPLTYQVHVFMVNSEREIKINFA